MMVLEMELFYENECANTQHVKWDAWSGGSSVKEARRQEDKVLEGREQSSRMLISPGLLNPNTAKVLVCH